MEERSLLKAQILVNVKYFLGNLGSEEVIKKKM